MLQWLFYADHDAAHGKELEILTHKQILQLLIAIAQVKASNISKHLLNEIGQILYSLYWLKEISKTIYNNVMNSIKV